MNTIIDIVSTLFYKIIDFFTPEDLLVEKVLRLGEINLFNILPKSSVNLKNISVLFEYKNKIVRLLIHKLKYKNHPKIKNILSRFLYDELIEVVSNISLWQGKEPIIVPMPMSKKEKNNKGFNQCEEILKEIKKIDSSVKINMEALSKTKETKRQATLKKEDRIKNVKYCMEAKDTLVKDQNIIVLDDVYTTLASFEEARRALLFAGAKNVYGIFIAH